MPEVVHHAERWAPVKTCARLLVPAGMALTAHGLIDRSEDAPPIACHHHCHDRQHGGQLTGNLGSGRELHVSATIK